MFSTFKAKTQDKAPPLFSAPVTSATRRASAWLDSRLEKARKEGVFAEVATLSPELSEILLNNNENNRRQSGLAIRRYSADIIEGNWELTGDTIKISKDGELNDGQHRCEAVILSGKSVSCVFVFGLERESRRKLDQGIKRTVGSILQMDGYADGNNLAHAARLVWTYEKHSAMVRTPEKTPTAAQIQEYVMDHASLVDSLAPARKVYKKLGISIGLGAALHHVFARIDDKLADRVFEVLPAGIGFAGKSDPLYRLWDRLNQNARAKTKLPETEIAALFVKAWNLCRDGASCRQLGWRSKGDQSEDFPVAR